MLSELAEYLDILLEVSKIEDSAVNGVQVGNTVAINKIATAVTASYEAIEKAAYAGANAFYCSSWHISKK